jgi:hypothetical protein
MDKDVGSHRVITEIIEELAESEGRMRAAKDKMNVPLLADAPDYASIVAHIAGQRISTFRSTLFQLLVDASPPGLVIPSKAIRWKENGNAA